MTVEAGSGPIAVYHELFATLDGYHAASALLFESLEQLNEHIEAKGKFCPILDDVRGPVAYIRVIEIPESLRGKGLGTSVVRELLLAIRKMGVGAVVLHAQHPWRDEQAPQQNFWYSLGFLVLRCADGAPAMGLQLTPGSIPRVESYPVAAQYQAAARLRMMGAIPNGGRTFIPPEAVALEAIRGLELRSRQPPSHRCCTAVGLARAKQLKNRQPVSVETLKRMRSYFQRHAVDMKGARWAVDSKGFQAWLLWGGDSGRDWANRTLEQLER